VSVDTTATSSAGSTGFAMCIWKPIDFDRLLTLVATHCS